MKLLTSAVILPAIVVIAFSGQVQSADIALNICGSVESDNKSRLRDQLKSNKLRLKKIYNKISCNGNSLLRFAIDSGSDKVGVFMVKRLPVGLLTSNEADGKSVYQWAQDNGKSDSLIGQAIKTRAKL